MAAGEVGSQWYGGHSLTWGSQRPAATKELGGAAFPLPIRRWERAPEVLLVIARVVC